MSDEEDTKLASPAPRPIAACEADGVEAWSFPFWIRPAEGFEPAFLLLEDHLYNLEADEAFSSRLVRIDGTADLERLGFTPDPEGIWRI